MYTGSALQLPAPKSMGLARLRSGPVSFSPVTVVKVPSLKYGVTSADVFLRHCTAAREE